MRISVLRFALFMGLAISFWGCQQKVKLESITPVGEVTRGSSIYFNFDHELAPKDSLGKWLGQSYILFEPALSGRFRWTSASQLEFAPTESWPLATEISYTINPEAFSGVSISQDEITPLYTEYMKLSRSSLSWAERSYYFEGPVVKLSLYFRREVRYSDIGEHISIYHEGKELEDFQVSYNWGSEHEVTWKAVGDPRAEQQYEIVIDKDLRSEDEGYPMREEHREVLTLKPVDQLSVRLSEVEMDEGRSILELAFNQQVDEKELRAHLEIYPDVDYEVQTRGHYATLTGKMSPGVKGLLRISPGMEGVLGGSLDSTFEASFKIPGLDPFLRFADQDGIYLQRNGLENVAVKSANVDSFFVELYEVYENNLVHFLDANYYEMRGTNYRRGAWDYYYGGGDYVTMRDYGRKIHTQKVMLNADRQNEVLTTVVDVPYQLRNKFQGIYVLKARTVPSDDDSPYYWGSNGILDSKVISLSDVGIVAKQSKNAVHVFVNALSSARPLAGVTLQLHSETNQVIASGVSNGAGYVRLEPSGRLKDFEPRFITSRYGNDFNFLDFDLSEVDQDVYDVEFGDRGYGSSKTQKAFVYAESNLYRPGDTVHASVIIRDQAWNAPGEGCFFYRVEGPGSVSFKGKSRCNAQGGFEFEYRLQKSLPTGRYSIYVEDAMEQDLGYYSFQVEEFVPDKIQVNLTREAARYLPGDTMRFPLSAQYFYGAPCDSHRYEVSYEFEHEPFYSSRYKGYEFSEQEAQNEDLHDTEQSDFLNEKGQDTLEYILPENLKSGGKISGRIVTTVFDNTGRTVRRGQKVMVLPRDRYYGLRLAGNYFNLGQNVEIRAVAVDNSDRPVQGAPVAISIYRKEWSKLVEQGNDGVNFISKDKDILEYTDTIRLSGDYAEVNFRPVKSGNYTVVVSDIEGEFKTHSSFKSYGSTFSTVSSFAADRSGAVDIYTDQKTYNSGETARILFTTPFAGRMLVTVERDKMYSYYYLDVPKNSAELRLPIREEHLPNIFISATLFRPQLYRTQLPMTVAHGLHNISVKSERRTLPLDIRVPDNLKPGNPLTMRVKAPPGSVVSMAMVDEGILSINGYSTPDPYSYFYQNQRLRIKSYDLYRYLLPEVSSAEGLTGGGLGYYNLELGAASLLNPIQSERFKSLTYWSGLKTVGPSGETSFTVSIPKEFNGQLRMVAVGYKNKQFGSAKKQVISRDDVVMTPGIPRFVAKGDSFVVPINLINLTDQAGNINVKLQVEGPLAIQGVQEQSEQVPAKGGKVMEFKLHTLDSVGLGKIQLLMSGLDERQQDFEIAVRPPETREQEGGSGVLEAGDTTVFQIPGDFYPEFQSANIVVSNLLAIRMGRDLTQLLQYPYGCVEQTVSKLFPQLYYPEIVQALVPGQFAGQTHVQHIREGIQRLEAQQLYNGALAYWPGGGYASEWGSVYAAHFLVEAQKRGYPVSQSFLDKLLGYLEELSIQDDRLGQRYYINGLWSEQNYYSKSTIYSLYVLALAERPAISRMNFLKSKTENLSRDSKYLLAVAYALSGDQKSFAELIPKEFNPILLYPGRSSFFDSSIRSNALVLSALMDVAPEHPHVPEFQNLLLARINKIYSTQEQAWAFLALGKATQIPSDLNVELWVNGERKKKFMGQTINLAGKDLRGKKVELRCSGKGKAYYSWQISGIRSGKGVETKDRSSLVHVHRTLFDDDGQPIERPIFKQGELLKARLTLRASEDLDNLVVQDLLPGAFEIENSRLRSLEGDPAEGSARVQHRDIRDDRMLFFVDLRKDQPLEIWYQIRVVGRGTFLQAPLALNSMYRPDAFAYRSGQQIKVLGTDAELPFRAPASLHPDCVDVQGAQIEWLLEYLGDSTDYRKWIRERIMNAS